MKMKKMLGTLAALVGMATAAEAQSNVFVTGSTAFRAQIFAALGDLGLNVQQSGTSGNNSFTFTGTISDHTTGGTNLSLGSLLGNPVTVYCNFSGSAEGVDDLISPANNSYLKVGASGTFSTNQIDLALSDVSQNSTPDANSPDQLEEVQLAADANAHNGIPGTGIAVQAFCFVVDGQASTIKNITQLNFHDLYVGSGQGHLGIGLMDGSTNTNYVYAVGRYPLSGTRIATILDDQFGAPASKLTQWGLVTNGGTNVVGLASTDSGSPPSVAGETWISVGTNGYFSGGNVGKAIHSASVNGAPAAIGYVGFADAAKLTGTSNEAPVNWNGQVSYLGSPYPQTTTTNYGQWNIPGVENGSYTFWSYERLYVSDNDQSSWYDETFAPGLIQAVQYEITHLSGVANPYVQTAVLESQMNVFRANDGSDVTHF
jgi:hypothetical protein